MEDKEKNNIKLVINQLNQVMNKSRITSISKWVMALGAVATIIALWRENNTTEKIKAFFKKKMASRKAERGEESV